ncbi:CoA-transferase family III [Tistlia consotensis]|uniref:CoA-transferase family III n=1 Tax=Tistlia consotensis USBA 355 TaxID=560819 RepID=A0A1Y6CI75_9PROT|nr:CoA transferase [Tistlia consotensis]SMF65848.1 CoA-transferase family III [Tistlia consotensis USBA 355]SNS03075.1 CoA-transferase family III [Tistlia consotensis]
MLRLLDGVRVIEAGHVVLGPYAGQFLGDFGADVVEIEPIEGDVYRGVGLARSRGMSAQWMACNRLVHGADAFLHNMRETRWPGSVSTIRL